MGFRLVVIIAVLREVSDLGLCVLVQKRLKRDNCNADWWELPQGGLEPRENILQAATRELSEETSLKITDVLSGGTITRKGEVSVLDPYSVVVDHERLLAALAVVVEADGEPQNSFEAKDHAWVPVSSIHDFLASHKVFPIDGPVLENIARDFVRS